MFSVLEMFKIGVGPSSSHTVGPMCAAQAFVASLDDRSLLWRVARVHTTLYGSLALTGLGHGTDRAAVAGLEGNMPDTVDTDHVLTIHEECDRRGTLTLLGKHTIAFDFAQDVELDGWHRMAVHPNGMRFVAYDDQEAVVDEQVWYSVGGGFVRQGHVDDPVIGMHERVPQEETMLEQSGGEPNDPVPFDFTSCDELIAICREHDLSIAQVVWRNELTWRSDQEIRSILLHAWDVMRDCVERGCHSTMAVLPGGLQVPRRAPGMYRRLAAQSDVLGASRRARSSALQDSDAAWVDLFALAVNEENAGGGRIVTAPTNGSAGIMPAVMSYYWHFVDHADEDGIVEFLLTAGAIGYLFKRNASISGAEVGCQGEVGSACSMAAAGLCAVMGGTPEQVENAAEIGIEHHLGLTCDPVAGLVQVPCIERNAMASNTAINAVRMAMLGDGTHIVSLDQAIKTMKDTGEDMMAKYKETSKGGLAVNVVEC